MTDSELLAEYISSGSERAFAEIVERHVARVLATCQRILGDRQEAEDAAQATFLLLVRKARSPGRGAVLSGWLYLAARNVALSAVKRRARRAGHEKEAGRMQPVTGDREREMLWTEVRPELDVALAGLSGHQRDAVLLRYLYGRSQEEAAAELGCSRESVALAAARGIEKLRRRLVRRGVAVPAAAPFGPELTAEGLGALLVENGAAAVPAGLAGSVTAACLGKAAASAGSLGLLEGTMKAMAIAKVKLAAAAVAAAVAVSVGGGMAASRLLAGEGGTAEIISKAPVNQWVRLQDSGGAKTSSYSAPVWVPLRRQLMHYNMDGAAPVAFDAAQVAWVAEPAPGGGTSPAAMAAELTKSLGGDYRWPIKGGKFQQVMNTACWDSKRGRIVYAPYRLTFAYDPEKRAWEDLKAKAVIDGKEFAGGLPVFGAGACYDPVNDEIVMFPHWVPGSDGRYGRDEPINTDRRDIDGRIGSHLGTLIFSCKDNTWRRAAETIGSPEFRKVRGELFAVMKAASDASDEAYALRRGKGQAKPEAVAAALAKGAADLTALTVPTVAKDAVARASKELSAAATAAGKADWGETVPAAGRALWILNAKVIDGFLRVEPPPRCSTAMVYDPERKRIVMFGGRDGLVRSDLVTPYHMGGAPGKLNDTWVYDCASRRWRELACPGRPPEQDRARLFYHPGEKKVFLVDFEYNWKTRKPPFDVKVWTLDVEAGAWSERLALKWDSELNTRDEQYEVGFDPERSLLVFNQFVGKGQQEVYFMRLDLAAAPAKPAPEWKAPQLRPQEIPPDDPAWVAKLKTLPANEWVDAKPPAAPSRRDWGNVACDPVRGHVYYFGGGHSTYQVNDVAIYAVGANKWSFATGDHNDLLPPTGWGGCCVGYRGGMWAHHQRNQYAAVDGRMFVGVDIPWFYDLDRGGVWRQRRFAGREKDKDALDQSAVHVVTPDGRVLGLLGQNMVSSMADAGPGKSGLSSYAVYANTLAIRHAEPPFPNHLYEHRPLCYVPDRDQIFFYELAGQHRTWVFDVKTCKWTDLKPKKNPFDGPGGTVLAEYIEGQDAVWCALMNRNEGKRIESWVYSFKRNSWTRMDEKCPDIGGPYGQAAYVARYGVLVAVPKQTRVMRPDVEKLKWE